MFCGQCIVDSLLLAGVPVREVPHLAYGKVMLDPLASLEAPVILCHSLSDLRVLVEKANTL